MELSIKLLGFLFLFCGELQLLLYMEFRLIQNNNNNCFNFCPNFSFLTLNSGRWSAMWIFDPLFINDWLQVFFFHPTYFSRENAMFDFIFFFFPPHLSSFIRLNRVYVNNLSKEKKFGKRCLMIIPIRTFNSLFSRTPETSKCQYNSLTIEHRYEVFWIIIIR